MVEKTRRMRAGSSRMRMMRSLRLLGRLTSRSSNTMATGAGSWAFSSSYWVARCARPSIPMSLEPGPVRTRRRRLALTIGIPSRAYCYCWD